MHNFVVSWPNASLAVVMDALFNLVHLPLSIMIQCILELLKDLGSSVHTGTMLSWVSCTMQSA